MIINGSQLYGEIVALGIPPHRVDEADDASYQPPQSDWLLGDFHRWYFRALEAFDIRPYEPEQGDCDDYSSLYCALARIAHRRTPAGKNTGLPLRRFNYLRVPDAPPGPLQQKHAIVLARTVDQGWIFIEPQILGRRENPTLKQLQSCSRCSE